MIYYMTATRITRSAPRWRAGIPEPFLTQIRENIAAIDQALPGVQQALEDSALQVIYDPDNLHGFFVSGSFQACYIAQMHALYLGSSGIYTSMVHEAAHILDMLAGPTPEQTLAKFGLEQICPYSIYHFWPQGGRFMYGEKPTNPEGAFVLSIIASARVAQQDEAARQAAIGRLLGSSVIDIDDNDFIQERLANLTEEFVYTWQIDHHLLLRGVMGADYFSTGDGLEAFWGGDWIRENEAHIRGYFQGMLDTIREQCSDGTLQAKLNENRAFIALMQLFRDDLDEIR